MKTDRSSFEIFKSNVCHQVKEQGELEFIKKMSKNTWNLTVIYIEGENNT